MYHVKRGFHFIQFLLLFLKIVHITQSQVSVFILIYLYFLAVLGIIVAVSGATLWLCCSGLSSQWLPLGVQVLGHAGFSSCSTRAW